jgi:hypothetical protein
LLPLSGCAGEVERRWSEEVELDGGKSIVIDRYVKFSQSNSLAGDAYSSTDFESKLVFKDELTALPSWDIALVPIVLDQDPETHEWVIVATTSNCDTWYEKGGPVPPYWEYRLSGDRWIPQKKLSEASIGRKTNRFFNYEPDLPARRLSRQLKAEILRKNDFAKKYLSVVGDMKRTCMKREG